jgi:hypothetical protein
MLFDYVAKLPMPTTIRRKCIESVITGSGRNESHTSGRKIIQAKAF